MVLRGPFDFIGNWIQGSEWFPIEINVPDTFGAVGNAVGVVAQGVGTFAQGVGSNISGFAQNVGQGFQSLSQNVGNGFQNFAQFFSQRPNTVTSSISANPAAVYQTAQSPNIQQAQLEGGLQNQPLSVQQTPPVQQKYFILVPMGTNTGNGQNKLAHPFLVGNNMPFDSDMLFETFP